MWEIFREKIPKSCGRCYEITSFNTKVKVTSDLSELVLCENRQTRTTELRKCFRQDLSRFQSMFFRDMFYVFPFENRPQETIKVVWNERINPPVRARNSSGFYQGIPADVCQHKWFNCFVIHGQIPFRMPPRERSPFTGTKIWEMGLFSWQERTWR